MLPPIIIALLFTFGSFSNAVDLDIDIEGNYYVVDSHENLLVKFSPAGDSLGAVGGYGRGDESFDEPVAVYARRGTEVYVADHNNHRIQRFDRRMDLVSTLYTRDDVEENVRFGYPRDVAVSRQGELFVLDGENRRAVVFDVTGRFVRSFGEPGDGQGRMVDPVSLELDGTDNVYVLDKGTIKLYDPFGSWIGHVPTPSGQPVLSFSIERDTMELMDAEMIWFYDTRKREFVEVSDHKNSSWPRQIRRHQGRFYEVFADHVRVHTIEREQSDTLLLQEQKRSSEG